MRSGAGWWKTKRHLVPHSVTLPTTTTPTYNPYHSRRTRTSRSPTRGNRPHRLMPSYPADPKKRKQKSRRSTVCVCIYIYIFMHTHIYIYIYLYNIYMCKRIQQQLAENHCSGITINPRDLVHRNRKRHGIVIVLCPDVLVLVCVFKHYFIYYYYNTFFFHQFQKKK